MAGGGCKNDKASQAVQSPGTGPRTNVQSVGHLTRKSGVLGSIPGLATYFRFSFRFFKKGSCLYKYKYILKLDNK